jgi:hypothetical protein
MAGYVGAPPQRGAYWNDFDMKTKPKDTPLQVVIEDGQIVLRIGIDTLAFCALAKNGGTLAENLRIDDAERFAKDVIREWTRENEIGASPLTDSLDAAMKEATDQGSTAVRELKRKAREIY